MKNGETEDGDIFKANISLEMRLPICKKCKQFLCIEFHDYMNLKLLFVSKKLLKCDFLNNLNPHLLILCLIF